MMEIISILTMKQWCWVMFFFPCYRFIFFVIILKHFAAKLNYVEKNKISFTCSEGTYIFSTFFTAHFNTIFSYKLFEGFCIFWISFWNNFNLNWKIISITKSIYHIGKVFYILFEMTFYLQHSNESRSHKMDNTKALKHTSISSGVFSSLRLGMDIVPLWSTSLPFICPVKYNVLHHFWNHQSNIF